MNDLIYKYQIQIKDTQIIKLPKYGKILSCQVQRGEVWIWYLFQANQMEYWDRSFVLVPTGDQFDYINLTYIDTFQLGDGYLVFHLFVKDIE